MRELEINRKNHTAKQKHSNACTHRNTGTKRKVKMIETGVTPLIELNTSKLALLTETETQPVRQGRERHRHITHARSSKVNT